MIHDEWKKRDRHDQGTYIAQAGSICCVVLECDIGDNIRSELWHDWDSAEKRACCRFFSDISCTADFGRKLTDDEASDIRRFIEETRAAVSRETKK